MRALRLLPLGLAALNSLPTSDGPPTITVSKSTPFDGETGVPVEVQPLVTITVEDGADPPSGAWLELLAADGTPVAATVEVEQARPPIYELRLVPAAPLPAGDYRLVVTGAEPGWDMSHYPTEARFTTLSRPRLLGVFLGPRELSIELSQPVDVDSLAAHVRPLGAVSREAGHRHRYELRLPEGTALVDVGDGVLAADGTPIAGLPVHLAR